jgi:hypothetical protein
MQRFKVWLRPGGNECKVRVEGTTNAEWLRRWMEQNGMQLTPSLPVAGTTEVVFHATYPPQVSQHGVQQSLRGMPEVELMHDPA